ncbi:MAG: YabP/YqfC family sporulation protein [Clostridia bacterium]
MPYETEIAMMCDKETLALIGGFKVSMYGFNTIVVEGISSVKKYNTEYICIMIKQKRLEIQGETLYIKHFSQGIIAIGGIIKNISMT